VFSDQGGADAPAYLHDGSAATVRDVLTIRNRNDQHGNTGQFSPDEIDDLCQYLLPL
jgi:hypothetical protein